MRSCCRPYGVEKLLTGVCAIFSRVCGGGAVSAKGRAAPGYLAVADDAVIRVVHSRCRCVERSESCVRCACTDLVASRYPGARLRFGEVCESVIPAAEAAAATGSRTSPSSAQFGHRIAAWCVRQLRTTQLQIEAQY